MKIAIIDGQGAGLGKTIIKKLRKELQDGIYITALGTNPAATSNMVKAGADMGITGEKAICSFCKNQQVAGIIGPVGIICSGALIGEITTDISKAIFDLECTIYIIPLQKQGIYIPGT
ncbi:MAG: DUF3842 family protein, partial [Bacillota bacterium]|nr:DUF3842 family protein [Bacillota bacterium]